MVTTAKPKQKPKPGDPNRKPDPKPQRKVRSGQKRVSVQRAVKKTSLNARQRKALMGDHMLEDSHLSRVDRHTFTIFVFGDPSHKEGHSDLDYGEPGVEYMMADRFEINLNILSGIDPLRPILIVMASCGGSFEAGMQMFAAILACPNPVTVMAIKWARSMTSIIPLAADKFVMRPPAKYMYHWGTYGFNGTSQEAETDDIERRKQIEMMLRIYVERLKAQGRYSGHPPSWIRNQLDRQIQQHIDVWLSSDDAVEWGFADAVFDGDHDALRATKVNHARRKRMMEVLRQPITVEVKVS